MFLSPQSRKAAVIAASDCVRQRRQMILLQQQQLQQLRGLVGTTSTSTTTTTNQDLLQQRKIMLSFQQQQKHWFSTEPQAAEKSESRDATTTKELPKFEHSKAEELFLRIIQQCSKEDIVKIADIIQFDILKIEVRPGKEWYYDGFGNHTGKKKGKGGAGGVDDDAAAEPAAPAKTNADLKLVSYDEKSKIKVIKEVRACVPGLGLKEAKEMVEGIPKVLLKQIKIEDAEELKKKLEEAGAVVELV